ncbi:hypothetical protein J0910_00505 [Nocardiopsis sp. CNT-189]|uniref:hypothetical protein n=1 Tax=Nocardiopsis oceanisediminis TaxID=2816862 RepID=UPI003B2D231E
MNPKTVYSRHRRRRIAEGRWSPWGDLEQVRARVRALEAAGHTRRSIATAAGLADETVQHLMSPKARQVKAFVADAILAADPWSASAGYLPAIGATRRLQALAALGWTIQDAAAHTGLASSTIAEIRRGGHRHVQAPTHRAIVAAYDQLSMRRPLATPGAAVTRGKAARRNWAPPLAWDDDSIDDPAAVPHTAMTKEAS